MDKVLNDIINELQSSNKSVSRNDIILALSKALGLDYKALKAFNDMLDVIAKILILSGIETHSTGFYTIYFKDCKEKSFINLKGNKTIIPRRKVAKIKLSDSLRILFKSKECYRYALVKNGKIGLVVKDLEAVEKLKNIKFSGEIIIKEEEL